MLGMGVDALIEKVWKLEYPERKYMDIKALEVRPILPRDLGLENWVWGKDPVRIKPNWYIALGGIYSSSLLQVEFRTIPFGNIRAAVTTGQPLYDALFLRREESLLVNWKPMEDIGGDYAKFSIQGFVIEPVGMTVTG